MAIARYEVVIVAGISSPILGNGGIVAVLYIESTSCKDPNTKRGPKISSYFIPSLIELVPGHPYKWAPALAHPAPDQITSNYHCHIFPLLLILCGDVFRGWRSGDRDPRI